MHNIVSHAWIISNNELEKRQIKRKLVHPYRSKRTKQYDEFVRRKESFQYFFAIMIGEDGNALPPFFPLKQCSVPNHTHKWVVNHFDKTFTSIVEKRHNYPIRTLGHVF